MRSTARLIAGIICFCLLSSFNAPPKIVNIVNFIRLLEPRDAAITEEVLYQTVVKQVQIMKKYRLGGTFLLQYDALMDSRYQNLLKALPRDRSHYPVTPATSFSVGKDIAGSDLKTVWFNSRYYRTNILWEKGTVRIRDIHLFDEKKPSVYEKTPVTENECTFFTLPFVDGYIWSRQDQIAGMKLYAMVDGKKVLLEGDAPVFRPSGAASLHISWPLKTVKGSIEMELTERKMNVTLTGGGKLNWWFELTTAEGAKLPFETIRAQRVNCGFEGIKYEVQAEKGIFSKPEDEAVLRISAVNNIITLAF